MEAKYSYVYSIWIFCFLHSFVSANLCPDSTLCNCILTDGTDLEITCTSVLSPSVLPTLNNSTLQADVTTLHVRSTIAGSSGPLTTLPTNLCSAYPNLNTLDLASNSISGLLNTSELACLGSNLISIDLSNNLISGINLNFFQSNRALQTIDLSQNSLTVMPLIDYAYFFDFVTTITFMNLSYNQITHVDFWPIFVKTQQSMIIDMSHNLIQNYTNTVPVFVKDLTETPDPRIFYLNNNQLEYFSDILLEQYGACATLSNTSTPYFIVGVSNVLLTNNPLTCDCQSYNLVNFVSNHLYDYPMLYNRSALLVQAQCTSPASLNGQWFLFSNYTSWNLCNNYTLPGISNAYCSVYTNPISTLAPPVYTSRTTTVLSTTVVGLQTTTVTEEEVGENGVSITSKSSGSPSWYIILGIVLGLLLLIFLIALGCFLCKDHILPERCRSNLKNSYKPFIGHQNSTSEDDGMNLNAYHTWDGKVHPAHETQTCFQIVRSKPASGPPKINRAPQKLRNLPGNKNNDNSNAENPSRKRKTSSSSTDAAPDSNGTHVIKGIPLTNLSKKSSTTSSNGSYAPADTSTFELSMTSIPLTPSKRAKLLPPLRGGTFFDSSSNNLLNTSASGGQANRRQRRLSATWSHRQNQSFLASSSSRPHSMNTPKNVYHNDGGSSDDEKSSVPTVEGLTNKSSKPLRALPLLNITVVPAWIDNQK